MTITSSSKPGCLYIVATPIGHLQDISARAVSILKQVDLILAEDTRHASILLQHYQISTRLESYHAHNEQKKSEHYFSMLQKSTQLALISDAGTPMISDPGFPLIQLARAHEIPVVPIPGPNAAICALSAAGLPTDAFSFYGFPPTKAKARMEFFDNCLKNKHTVVFYESKHRLMDSLKDLSKILGENQAITMAKELTKTHEQFIHRPLAELISWLQEDALRQKGEFVLIIPPRELRESFDDKETYRILKILCQAHPHKQAVDICQQITGKAKNILYRLALDIKNTEFRQK